MSINGSSDNNAIALPDGRTQGTYVIRDDEDPDANRRYKMVYENYSARLKHMSMRTATSPDGLKWTAGPDTPLNDGTDIGAFYKHDGLYIMGAHDCFRASEGGYRQGRQGYVWLSPDFNNWLLEGGQAFMLPEAENTKIRGLGGAYVQVHLGVAPIGLGNVLVGVTCIWDPTKPKKSDWFGPGTTFGDFSLVVSNDGQRQIFSRQIA